MNRWSSLVQVWHDSELAIPRIEESRSALNDGLNDGRFLRRRPGMGGPGVRTSSACPTSCPCYSQAASTADRPMIGSCGTGTSAVQNEPWTALRRVCPARSFGHTCITHPNAHSAQARELSAAERALGERMRFHPGRVATTGAHLLLLLLLPPLDTRASMSLALPGLSSS